MDADIADFLAGRRRKQLAVISLIFVLILGLIFKGRN